MRPIGRGAGCAAGCARSRREFMAASAGATAFLASPGMLQAAPSEQKARVRVVFALHEVVQARPDWPNQGFDFGPVMERTVSERAVSLGSAACAGRAQATATARNDHFGSDGVRTCRLDPFIGTGTKHATSQGNRAFIPGS